MKYSTERQLFILGKVLDQSDPTNAWTALEEFIYLLYI